MHQPEIQMPDWGQPLPEPDFLPLTNLAQECAHEDGFHCVQLAPIDELMMPSPEATIYLAKKLSHKRTIWLTIEINGATRLDHFAIT